MKDRTCLADEISYTSAEFDDDLMECDVFCELVKGLDQEVVFDMAQRLTNILGQEPLPADDEDDDDDADSSAEGSQRLPLDGSTGGPAAWEEYDDEALLRGLRDRSLLLAGYTECMDEAIRYLVEEEKYSLEHPLVQGLRQHLVDEQDRVLGAAQCGEQLDNARSGPNNNNNNNNNNVSLGGGEPDVSLVALLAGTILNIRQPSL